MVLKSVLTAEVVMFPCANTIVISGKIHQKFSFKGRKVGHLKSEVFRFPEMKVKLVQQNDGPQI